MPTIFNTTEHKTHRQALRQNMTEPEKRLWTILRNRQLGMKFRRQHGIGHYIADFYCPELKLVVEVDGHGHFEEDAQEYDRIRDGYMSALGIQIIRFTNDEVMHQLEAVHHKLMQHISQTE